MTRTLIATALIAGLAVAAYFLGAHSSPAAVSTTAAPPPSVLLAAAGTPLVVAHSDPPAATADTQATATTPATEAYGEGRHYHKVPTPTAPTDPGKITVEDFFWYGCPHCYRLESLLAPWRGKLPADVTFVRVPDSLGRPVGLVHERAFYTARMLGIEDRIHIPLMEALVVQQMPLISQQALTDFFVEQAQVKPGDVASDYSSAAVDADVQHANQLALNYQVTGVPVIVVGGEYLTQINEPGIYDARLSEQELYQRMLDVASFLIDKVRAERTKVATTEPAATSARPL